MGGKILGYFGHHKSASTWFELVSSQVCRELQLNFRILHKTDHLKGSLNSFIKENQVDFLAYSNADYRYIDPIEQVKGFHVVRDPRDICVSAYFSHKYSHKVDTWPEMQKHRDMLNESSFEKGLFAEMDWLEDHFEEMRTWKNIKQEILQYKMEEIFVSPYESMLDIFDYLGLVDKEDFTAGKRAKFTLTKGARKVEYLCGGKLAIPFSPNKLPAERFLGILWEHNFQRKAGGRELGKEDPTSHYRKGVPGDWKNYFTDEHLDYFLEKYRDILDMYGYESGLASEGQKVL